MRITKIIFALIIAFGICACQQKETKAKPHIVTTTTMITDLAQRIGGDSIVVQGLMAAGVDPHLYKASEGDVQKLTSSDAIFYNGLHLEGKMVEVFEKMESSGYKTFAISDGMPDSDKISSANFPGNYDPHIWFSVENWKKAAQFVASKLSELNPENKSYYDENLRTYLVDLDALEMELKESAAILPKEKRILVTAHDAFEYFGKEYDFEVIGLQGISTASEAGTKDMLDLANSIIEKNIPAIFVESSVPEKTIKALQNAVENKGKEVALGGTLYSDALGNPGTPQGTYIGMYKTNMETIVNALNASE